MSEERPKGKREEASEQVVAGGGGVLRFALITPENLRIH